MNMTAPHYLLFTEAKHVSKPSSSGRWRFVLEQIGTAIRIEEADIEPGVRGERLQLFAVVRGLEALEQRSRVTLITSSKYVGRGIRRGLTQWRQNDWQWENFGIMTAIKNDDLWKRVDRAMQIHQINCRIWQFDPPHVRTQVPSEFDTLDSLEKFETGAELVCSTNEGHPLPAHEQDHRRKISQAKTASHPARTVEASLGNGNHLRLNLNRNRPAGEKTVRHLNRVSDFLADKVKPIGQGRAFGYAIS